MLLQLTPEEKKYIIDSINQDSSITSVDDVFNSAEQEYNNFNFNEEEQKELKAIAKNIEISQKSGLSVQISLAKQLKTIIKNIETEEITNSQLNLLIEYIKLDIKNTNQVIKDLEDQLKRQAKKEFITMLLEQSNLKDTSSIPQNIFNKEFENFYAEVRANPEVFKEVDLIIKAQQPKQSLLNKLTNILKKA